MGDSTAPCPTFASVFVLHYFSHLCLAHPNRKRKWRSADRGFEARGWVEEGAAINFTGAVEMEKNGRGIMYGTCTSARRPASTSTRRTRLARGDAERAGESHDARRVRRKEYEQEHEREHADVPICRSSRLFLRRSLSRQTASPPSRSHERASPALALLHALLPTLRARSPPTPPRLRALPSGGRRDSGSEERQAPVSGSASPSSLLAGRRSSGPTRALRSTYEAALAAPARVDVFLTLIPFGVPAWLKYVVGRRRKLGGDAQRRRALGLLRVQRRKAEALFLR
ncbi:hypothetical protein DFH09DRAFT_1330081 [Mycena vulgaris]|nr:hypothetical protein DFH09DRAFT_1330081 [Mycena vulgaris]